LRGCAGSQPVDPGVLICKSIRASSLGLHAFNHLRFRSSSFNSLRSINECSWYTLLTRYIQTRHSLRTATTTTTTTSSLTTALENILLYYRTHYNYGDGAKQISLQRKSLTQHCRRRWKQRWISFGDDIISRCLDLRFWAGDCKRRH
jgi:hypothetical protein